MSDKDGPLASGVGDPSPVLRFNASMGFSRASRAKVRQDPVPALAAGLFGMLVGVVMIAGGLWIVRSGNTPLWLGWTFVASAVFATIGAATDTVWARQGLRDRRARADELGRPVTPGR